MQQNSWAQGRPTHGRETSPNRTHNKTQGNHEVRALQQPPNAAHAERAISKHPPSLYKVPTYSTRAGAAPRAPGGARHGGGNRAVNSQPGTGQSTLYGDVKSSYGGAGGWDRRGCATWAPRSATRQGEEQHRHTERVSHTRRDKGGHSRQGGGAQQGGRGNWNSGNREPEWSGWQSVRMGGSDNKGDGLASQPRRYRVPGQPLLNRHQVGGVSRSPDGLFAQQEWEPIRGRPAVRGKGAYGGRPGQRVEEGTWAAQKHSEAGDGRPVDRGVWTAKTVKRPRQQPAHPQYANYWAPLTRKRHTMPHPAQSQHANYWAPRTRKRHQQEHRPQRPTESSDPTQHAKGRTGDRPGPRKGATTRRNVTQGVGSRTPTPPLHPRPSHARATESLRPWHRQLLGPRCSDPQRDQQTLQVGGHDHGPNADPQFASGVQCSGQAALLHAQGGCRGLRLRGAARGLTAVAGPAAAPQVAVLAHFQRGVPRGGGEGGRGYEGTEAKG